MAQTYRNNLSVCATCNVWGGRRDINTFHCQVTVDSARTEGKCLHPTAGWLGSSVQAGSTCSDWVVWGDFR
jgi:hypothetical protein